jgi:hypothetical protein
VLVSQIKSRILAELRPRCPPLNAVACRQDDRRSMMPPATGMTAVGRSA